MVSLPEPYKSKAYFHLYGAGGGIQAGDLAGFEEVCARIPNDTVLTQIKAVINSCDKSWQSLQAVGPSETMYAETYAGDINRTIVKAQKSLELAKYWRDIYYYWVDQLARVLWVTEFRTPNSDHYRYARYGGEYVNSLPGARGDDGDALMVAMRFA